MRISRTKLLPRKTNVRDAWLCIIATEGQKTEKQYFEMFQSERVEVVVLPTSDDNKSSPQEVYKRLALFREQFDLGREDQLWLMIDIDHWAQPNHIKNLATICKEARRRNLRLAISNPCFELWLLLHHSEIENVSVTCEEVENLLRTTLGEYNKSNVKTHLFRDKIADAVRRAESLDNDLNALWPGCPGTHIYRIIKVLPVSPLLSTHAESIN